MIEDIVVSPATVGFWPIASVALRSAALIAVALLLIFVLLPAVVGAAGAQVPVGG